MNDTIIYVLVLIIFILFILYILYLYEKTQNNLSQFGTYGETIIGQCVNLSNLCTEQGVQTNYTPCIINPITGKGCIDENGLQTFSPKIVTQSCTLPCFSSIWELTNVTDCIAQANPDNPSQNPAPPNQCLPKIFNDNSVLTGTKQLTYTCISKDSTGPNNCTSVALTNIVGPTNISGVINLLQTYDVGDSVEVTEPCNPVNPACGYWINYADKTYINFNQIDDNLLSSCIWSNIYTFSSLTQVDGGNSAFTLFKEGLIFNNMLCLLEDNVGVLPKLTDSQTTFCLQNPINISCNTNSFNVNQVPNNSLNNNIITNPFICANAYNNSNFAQNPVCLKPGKLFPTTQTTITNNQDFNFLINNPFIMFNNNNYLSSYQLPRTDNNSQILFSNMYEPDNVFPASNISLFSTQLLAIPLGYVYLPNGSKSDCSNQELVLSTSLLNTLSFVSNVGAGEMIVKISSFIPSFNGWLMLNGNTINWSQQVMQYLGPGINYNSASQFLIRIITPFIAGSVTGYPNSIGTMTIQIRTSGNGVINNIDLATGGNIQFFEDVNIIIFDYRTFDYSDRANLTSTSCNLYIDTEK